MVKNLKFKKDILLGLKITIAGIIPGAITALILNLTNFQMDPVTFKDGVILGFSLLLNLYLTGFFVNKWKKWIFK